MLTYLKEYNAKVPVSILVKSAFFKNIITKDKNILQKNKAIDIKLTARKHQVSIEALLSCLDYLDHSDFKLMDCNPSNMLSLLVTANFLGISELEQTITRFVLSNLKANNIVQTVNIALQTNNHKLLDEAYM